MPERRDGGTTTTQSTTRHGKIKRECYTGRKLPAELACVVRSPSYIFIWNNATILELEHPKTTKPNGIVYRTIYLAYYLVEPVREGEEGRRCAMAATKTSAGQRAERIKQEAVKLSAEEAANQKVLQHYAKTVYFNDLACAAARAASTSSWASRCYLCSSGPVRCSSSAVAQPAAGLQGGLCILATPRLLVCGQLLVALHGAAAPGG
ncbi:hypothetical protein GQ600_1710 [Phytophthora cactorum]|nr:hypothetical protein GQ600_1710 [Phytophthora cactorum]